VIAYQLICTDGHEFEGWFKDSAAYDCQADAGDLACPVCGDAKIAKAIMAPSVKTSVTKAKGNGVIEVPSPKSPKSQNPAQDPQKVRQFLAGFRKFIEENAEYVGRRFPEEARKIHYGETEERHIYGESTIGEAKELIEEGINVAPVPPDPADLN
jgi:hypothetical protein